MQYIATRALMALAALMCADAIANTSTAAEPTSILAAFFLIALVELIVAANVQDAQQLTAADVVEARQDAELRHHLNRLEDKNE